jgi:hypothetical protein
MAYNASNEERVNLVDIQKNNRGDHIKADVIINKTNGNQSIDIRQYYTNDNDEVMPTSKGVRFSTESAFDFIKGFVKCLETDELQDLILSLQEQIADVEDSEDDAPEEE